jgi:hypothetical protein
MALGRIRFSLPSLRFGVRDLAWAAIVVAVFFSSYWSQPSGPKGTGRELDLAVLGHGYFVVKQDNTGLVGYVREGRLSLDACGRLIVGRPFDGWVVQPEITLPSDHQEIHISQGGMVCFTQAGTPQLQQSGQLQLARFTAPEHLRELVPGVLQETQFSGCSQVANPGQAGIGLLAQGRLEATNSKLFDWRTFASLVGLGLAIIAVREVRKLRDATTTQLAASQVVAARFEAPTVVRHDTPVEV